MLVSPLSSPPLTTGEHSGSTPTESLLVFSDVHLGSDIHDGAVTRPRRSTAVDRDLIHLLTHYRAQAAPSNRWRIVIAGDFIDFIGMSISPPKDDGDETSEGHGLQRLETELTDEEREHGLGSASDHARMKLRRVATRHADVFAALAGFVADGHALSLIHGNHDIEFHWDEVKSDFREVLLVHALIDRPDLDREAFLERIEFNPWFFYRDGVAYIEHGHQYDPYCATEHIMSPVSPTDPRRVARAFCDTLLRFVVRPTGMKEHGHESVGLSFYLRLGAKLGVSGMATLGLRFARAVGELFRLRRAHLGSAAALLKAEHEERVAKLAEAKRIGIDRLRALLLLQAPPLGNSIRGILAGVLLDRLALALATALALVGLAIYSMFHGHALWGALGVLVTWSILNRWLERQRNVDPAENLVERAAQLARLFPAAFVVMGHTHVPIAVPAGDATYINVGSWAEDVADDDENNGDDNGHKNKAHAAVTGISPYRAARTHLVIHVRDNNRAEAQFCSWEDGCPQPRVLPTFESSAQSSPKI